MALETFLINFHEWLRVFSFLFGMFFAEETIFTLSILFMRNLVGIENILFAFLGVIFCNISMYFLGKYKILKPLKKFSILSSFLRKSEAKIEKISKGKMEKILFFSKFILGGRLIFSMLLGHREIKFSKFLKNTLIIELIWAVIAICFGIFANESYEFISKIVKGLALISFSSFVLIFGVFYTKYKIKEKALNNTGHNIIVEENGHSIKKRGNEPLRTFNIRKERLLRI